MLLLEEKEDIMSNGESRVIDPKIFEYLAKPESERVVRPSEHFLTDVNKQESSMETALTSSMATAEPPPQPKKGGLFSFLKRKPTAQKKLPALDLFPCGICDKSVEREDLFKHWFEHTVTVPDDQSRVGNDGPMRATSKSRSMVFVVRRPRGFPHHYDGSIWEAVTPFKDMELAIAKYFAYAITRLRQNQPGTRFQYQPTNITEYGWQTLLVIAEWEEE